MAVELAAYNDYEAEFLQRTSQLPARVSSLAQADGEAAAAELKEVEKELIRAKQNLKDMEMEVRGLPEPTRSQLGSKVKTYRESLETVSADLRKSQQRLQRASLLSSPAASRPLDFDKSLDARARMQANTEKLQGSTAVLDAAHGTLEETLNIAAGSMEELGRNRDTLNRVRSNVGVVSSTMDEARRIIRSMTKRELRTRLCVGFFALLLLGMIVGLIVYFTQRNKESSQ